MMSTERDDESMRPAPSRPRRAKGGIRAQTQRGGFAQSWWGKRWIEVLEALDSSGRLGRGRSYARGGQVQSIEIGKGKIVAFVQGSRLEPYRVVIRIRPLMPDEWATVIEALASRAVFAARLLAGEMPERIEDVFAEVGVSLFPSREDDLRTGCSCPDEANPCKHIAAVYYLLAEEFDRDPFLLFWLRGRTREELARFIVGVTPSVEKQGDVGADPDATRSHNPPTPESTLPQPQETGADRVQSFWGNPGAESHDFGGPVIVPVVSAGLVKRLGSFPFWRGEKPFVPAFEKVYAAASPLGMSVFLGEPEIAPVIEED
jgi:uncharacterized Zn finger protein